MFPIIVLIGQKNAGKSTLFNRLTCTNDALIADYAGLTRDRQYGYLHCKLFNSIIVDTGGIDRFYFDNIEIHKNSIYYQTILAIKESNIVLLVVDGHFGQTAIDCDIIGLLRKLEKNIFIVINKVDIIKSDERSIFIWRDYGFGIENIVTISAMHGYGINCLLKKLSYQIKQEKCINYNNKNRILIMNQDVISRKCRLKQLLLTSSVMETHCIILAVLGCPNVGKSTFINNILGVNRMITCDMPGTTRDSIYTSTIYNNKNYILIDTAGIRKKNKCNVNIAEHMSIKETLNVVKDAHIILFMIDADMGISDRDFFALNNIINIGISLMIIVNKWDNVSTIMRRTIKKIILKKIDFIKYIKVFFISALYGSGIKNLFQSIQATYNELINIRSSVNTSKLTRIMRAAIVKNPPPLLHSNVRIQPKYVHIGGYSPLVLIVHGSNVSKLSDDYQRYLKRYFYKNLNLIGIILHLQFKDTDNPFCKRYRIYNN